MPEAAKSTHTGVANLQGMLSVIPFFATMGILSITESAKTIAEQKKLDSL